MYAFCKKSLCFLNSSDRHQNAEYCLIWTAVKTPCVRYWGVSSDGKSPRCKMLMVNYASKSNAFWKYMVINVQLTFARIEQNSLSFFYNPFNKLWSLVWTELKNDSWRIYCMFNSSTTQFSAIWNLSLSVRELIKFRSVFNVLLIFFLIFFHSSSFVSSLSHPNITLCSTWEYGCQCIENMRHESHLYDANVNVNSCKLAAKYFSRQRKKKEKRKLCISVTFFAETNPFSSLTEMWKW